MREIKFRYICKDACGKIFTFFITLRELEQGKLNINTYGLIQEILSKDEYIGLKDKNGKEGYNSDLFKDKKGVIYLVDHDEDGWIFKNGDVGYRPSTFRTSIPYSLDGEFIGNIYENPELLEK